jgi:WD40 repeat protein
MGTTLDDMQVGCNWIGNYVFSISLSGFINYFDIDKPEVTRVVKGHNKAIICSTLSEDKQTLYTASFEGRICYWDIATGVADVIEGKPHTNQVQRMSSTSDTIVTCAMDDTVKFIDIATKKYCDETLKMDSQPLGVAAGENGLAVVACNGHVVLIKNRAIVQSLPVNYHPGCVDIKISPDGDKVAVGGDESKVRMYHVGDNQLKEYESFPTNGNVTDVKFSPDGFYVACSTGKKQVKIVSANDTKTEKGNFASHATKVNGIAWTPDNLYLASCGVDGVVFTWNITSGERGRRIQGAHSQSCDVTSVQWSTPNKLLTTGRHDCSVRVWDITH